VRGELVSAGKLMAERLNGKESRIDMVMAIMNSCPDYEKIFHCVSCSQNPLD